MPIIVMKFGGSCLIDKNAFDKILNITSIYKNVKKVYVASALSGITDLLLKTAFSLENDKDTDKSIALIEKRHIDIIEQIFVEESEHYFKVKDWIDKKLSELEDTFADIKEFGLEPYYKDYIMSFGEILSTYILNQYLLSNEIDSVFIPTNKLIITNDKVGYKKELVLRRGQIEAINYIENNFMENFLLIAPTAWGKTVVAIIYIIKMEMHNA